MENDLLLRAAKGEKTERPPVWVMRQAGRILPEYRAVRASVSGFKELVSTPELITEVTLQPVDILGVDAAIIFSDILVIPEAMGLDYEMIEKKGPFFPKTIESGNDIELLTTNSVEDKLQYVLKGIELTKRALNNRVPLIGFAGAPWTIFSYMIEGQGSKTFSKAKRFLYQFPEHSHQLLDKITEATITYLKLQIRQGADIVQVFDSWAGILSPQLFSDFGLPYIQKICNSITEVPVIVFAKGAFFGLEQMNNLNCEVVGLDWTIDPQIGRVKVPDKVLQGNLDPCVLYADKSFIKSKTTEMLNAFGKGKHIVNLGHGVYPDTPWENVKYFIDLIKERGEV